MSEQILNDQNRLLIVDDDLHLRERLSRTMTRRGFQVTTADSLATTRFQLRQQSFDYAILDLKLTDGYGLDLVESIKASNPDIRIIILTGYGNIATAVAAIKHGAVDYLPKPADADEIERALKNRTDNPPPPPEDPMSPDRVKWEHIRRVFAECQNNVSETARRLKMHRRTLQRILAKHAPRF
ncbi:ActR/PrrA/RegA family redox response regulator transcription factor [Candidatus Paracaedibacter symbiosus]|uniref:ActR/PrrA/RegA family redox response regulator transcription factor n=1 Tax=Candidatus Paracaedibacter symbiosus TaxID=244582 RepID=UPI000509CC54|nr:ActR/PrrA/RegA family redox response regulator transcription factor [Candidatus Paracaedibacter symbiosus]